LVRDGDIVSIDADANRLELQVDAEELGQRRAAWSEPPLAATQGTLLKYIRAVSSASRGCITDG
jgi:dihydroxy-acid dehydratase